jgi:tetratricopeptide (TPR) repeat protein
MKRRFLCAFLLTLSTAGLIRAQDSTGPPPPLSKADIFGRLAAGGSRSYVAHLVRVRGINFSPDDDFFAAIEQAGGEGVLLDRLRVAPDGDEDSLQGIGGDLVQHLANCARLQNQGDLTKAETECRAAMTADPRNAFAVLGTAQVLKLRNRDSEALPLMQQAVQLDASLSEAHYGLAMALDPGNDQYMQQLREANRLEPDELDFRPIFDAAWMQEPGGADPPTATPVHFRQAMRDAQEKECRDILQIEPDFAKAHADLADLLIQESRGDEALAEITEAVRLEPGVLTMQVEMGWIASAAGNENLSVQATREAVRLAPTNSEMRDRLARNLWNRNDFEGARTEFRECLDMDPGNWQCHRGLADMLEALGDLDGAIAEDRRLLAVNPVFKDERLDLARVLQNNGDFKGAFAECEEVLHEQSLEEPKDGEVPDETISLRAHAQLARIFTAEGLTADAVGELRAALAINPNATLLRFGLAEALDKAGASGQAEEELRDVLREDPNDALTNHELAWIYATATDRRYRNPAAALEIALKAVKLSSGNRGFILDTLAEAYYANHRLAEALATEKKAIQLEPKNADLQAQHRKFQIAALSPAISGLRELR